MSRRLLGPGIRRHVRAARQSGTVPPPVNTVAPSVSLPALYEVGEVATCDPGTWTNANTFEYQWYIRGVAIAGATSNTYTLLGADLGGSGPATTAALFGDTSSSNGEGPPLTCGVVATGAGGVSDEVASSNDVRFDWAQYPLITQLIDERGLTSSGGFYDAWANQGSVATSWTASLTLRPAVGRTINGFPAPDFDGSNDEMNTTATSRSFICPGTTLDNTRYVYMWRVADTDTFNTAGNGTRPSQLPDNASGNMAFNTQLDTAGVLTSSTGANASVAPTGYRLSSVAAALGIACQETRLGGGSIDSKWNGADGTTATFNGNTAAPAAANTTSIGRNYTTTQKYNGAIATEICWADTNPIPNKSLQTVRAVLQGKYNVATGVVAP